MCLSEALRRHCNPAGMFRDPDVSSGISTSTARWTGSVSAEDAESAFQGHELSERCLRKRHLQSLDCRPSRTSS